jgi:ABC-type nickel/cobalt efflux system permease component RcnA
MHNLSVLVVIAVAAWLIWYYIHRRRGSNES